MLKKERAIYILNRLEELYPNTPVPLKNNNTFEIEIINKRAIKPDNINIKNKIFIYGKKVDDYKIINTNDLFPLFMFRKFNKVKFDKKLDNLIDVKSNILNIDKMKNLIYKNRGSKFSLKYKVLIILSAVLTEQYIKNEKKQ